MCHHSKIMPSPPPPRRKIILNSNPKILNNSWIEIQNHCPPPHTHTHTHTHTQLTPWKFDLCVKLFQSMYVCVWVCVGVGVCFWGRGWRVRLWILSVCLCAFQSLTSIVIPITGHLQGTPEFQCKTRLHLVAKTIKCEWRFRARYLNERYQMTPWFVVCNRRLLPSREGTTLLKLIVYTLPTPEGQKISFINELNQGYKYYIFYLPTSLKVTVFL